MAFRERFVGELRLHQDETVGVVCASRRISDVKGKIRTFAKKGSGIASAPFWFQSLLLFKETFLQDTG
jgi:hypothetical protein